MRNIALTLFFFFLLALSYVSQERSAQEAKKLEKERQVHFNPEKLGALQKIELDGVVIELVGKSYAIMPGRIPVNPEWFNKLLLKLADIHIVKKLEPENLESFFHKKRLSIKFLFEKGELNYQLGKKLNFSDQFYLLVSGDGGQTFGVGEDKSIFEGMMIGEEEHRSSAKYNQLIDLLSIEKRAMKDSQIFRSIERMKERLIGFKIDSYRNRPFTVDRIAQIMEPIPFEGVSLSPHQVDLFVEKLVNLKALDISVKKEGDEEGLLRSTLSLHYDDGKEMELRLYQLQDQKGYALEVGETAYRFSLLPQDISIFFESSNYFLYRIPFTSLKNGDRGKIAGQDFVVELGDTFSLSPKSLYDQQMAYQFFRLITSQASALLPKERCSGQFVLEYKSRSWQVCYNRQGHLILSRDDIKFNYVYEDHPFFGERSLKNFFIK